MAGEQLLALTLQHHEALHLEPCLFSPQEITRDRPAIQEKDLDRRGASESERDAWESGTTSQIQDALSRPERQSPGGGRTLQDPALHHLAATPPAHEVAALVEAKQIVTEAKQGFHTNALREEGVELTLEIVPRHSRATPLVK